MGRRSAASIMRGGDGIKPASEGKRVVFDGEGRTVIDGPFPAASELVARVLVVGGEGHGRDAGVSEAPLSSRSNNPLSPAAP